MFGTRSSRWGSFAKIGNPVCVFGAAMTQQLLPIAGCAAKTLGSDISGLGKLRYLPVPSGSWFFAVLRSKSFSFGTSGWEVLSLPSIGASQEEILAPKNSKAFGGKVLFSASKASAVCPGLS